MIIILVCHSRGDVPTGARAGKGEGGEGHGLKPHRTDVQGCVTQTEDVGVSESCLPAPRGWGWTRVTWSV